MELVGGPTLSERLRQGPFSLDEALPIAKQIAEGLEYAHERGVVHRDLKPANIKLTSDGAVKILDFGLAKAMQGDAASPDLSESPTISRMATQAGILLGTVAYMSPEQSKGKPIDRRTDIWAFGCVVFEMLSGRPAFTGDSVTDILASVVRSDPDWTQLPANTPSRIRELLYRCFQKETKKRLQAIGEARITLEDPLANPDGQPGSSDSQVTTNQVRHALRWKRRAGLFAALAVAAVFSAMLLAFFYVQRAPKSQQTVRTLVAPPANTTFKLISLISDTAGFALSPDGRRLVFSASSRDGRDMLYVRSLDSLEAQPLVGTSDGGLPFWSPDGRFIGFFADGKMKRIGSGGGPATTICDSPSGRGGAWNRDGVIIYSAAFNGPLRRISADGGESSPVTTLDASQNEISHRWPAFLPDGRHFLYLAGNPFAPNDNPTNAIKMGSLDSKEVKTLVKTRANAIYASGHILYLRQNELMAQPFDLKSLEVTGDAFPLGDEVYEDKRSVRAAFTMSENGMLAYAPISSGDSGPSFVLVDRIGKRGVEVACGGDCRRPSISQDGNSIAYDLDTPAYEIWTYDRGRDIKTRVTLSSAPTHSNTTAVWSPDGRWLAYSCFLNGKYGVCRKHSDGSGEEEVLFPYDTEQTAAPSDWSRDGKVIAFHRFSEGISSVWLVTLERDREARQFLHSQFSQLQGRFSPDGRWMAYCSNESGEYKVYVVPYPGPGGKWLISHGPGCGPRWQRDGKEIYYISSDKRLMAVQVKASGKGFEVGATNSLFDTVAYTAEENYFGNFDVTPDGAHFVLITNDVQIGGALTLVQNWNAGLKKK